MNGLRRHRGAAARFRDRAEQAEERLRRQLLVFAEAEHKLKTSLAIISGWAVTLDDRWDVLAPERRRDGIAAIRRSAERLASEAHRLLDHAGLELARLDLDPVPLDLAELLRSTTVLFDALSADHEIVADVDESVVVLADAQALHHVLGHLVENAVKYSPDGGVVVLRTRRHDDRRWGVLSVHDEGVGIPPEVDLFAPFVQGPAAERRLGVGLGLSIVYNLVEGMGGTVSAARNRGRGSTFTVRLPAVGR